MFGNIFGVLKVRFDVSRANRHRFSKEGSYSKVGKSRGRGRSELPDVWTARYAKHVQSGGKTAALDRLDPQPTLASFCDFYLNGWPDFTAFSRRKAMLLEGPVQGTGGLFLKNGQLINPDRFFLSRDLLPLSFKSRQDFEIAFSSRHKGTRWERQSPNG